MLLNESSIRMVVALRIQKILRSKIIVVVVVVNKIFRHSMAVHHSALFIIAIAQAYLKLENTVMIITLASALKKLSKKYCMLVGCSNGFIRPGRPGQGLSRASSGIREDKRTF